MKRKGIIIVILILLMCCITTTATTTAVILFIRSRETENLLNQQRNSLDESDQESSQSENNNTLDEETLPTYEIQDKSIIEDTESYSLNVIYPELINHTNPSVEADFNDLVFYKVNSLVREIRFSEPSEVSAKNSLDLDYSVIYQTERFLSIIIQGQMYTGGAHPNPVVITINYDFELNKDLALKDLFIAGANYLTPVSNTCIFQLQALLAEDFIESGASANAENFKNFNFTKTQLSITFDAYQVGSYAIGTPVVEMDLADFNPILKPEFK